jgi:hypothetical protein
MCIGKWNGMEWKAGCYLHSKRVGLRLDREKERRGIGKYYMWISLKLCGYWRPWKATES